MPSGCYNTFESLDYATRKITWDSYEIFWEAYCLFATVCKSLQTVAFSESVVLIQVFFFFFRYFTLFMNLLNDCSEVEDESAQTGGRKRGMSRRLASLRHCTVLAMSNLLNANVDSGLMHSIGKVVRDNCA